MEFAKRCWAEISFDALLFNLNKIKDTVGGKTDIMCVVKANAYGHGDEAVVPELERAGVSHFAVASVDEAMHLKSRGLKSEVVVLGACLDDSFPYAAKYGFSLSVCDIGFAERLSAYAAASGKTVKVHIKLNTGMSRVGIDCLNTRSALSAADTVERIAGLPGVEIGGIFTHFSVSDENDGGGYTAFQLDNFLAVRSELEKRGVSAGLWHCANSGAIVNNPESYMDMVRAGILLYGLYNGAGADNSYKSVLSLKTVITQIREIDAGTFVSYGRTYKADAPRKTAVISIGYGDGYPRFLSGRGRVIVNGQYAPVIGRVCMDQTIIDVTGIDCCVGDEVTVIGECGDAVVTADEIAHIGDTINYEIVCGIASRVPRVFYRDNKQAEIVKYI